MITAERYHDFSAGHRVAGHESKCAHLHGHNYRAHFTVTGDLDSVGRVMDFSVIKSILCSWLEDNWDHKFLIWEQDHLAPALRVLDPEGIRIVGFNPTAENMARFLVEQLGPELLRNTGVTLIACRIEETRKCSAAYSMDRL